MRKHYARTADTKTLYCNSKCAPTIWLPIHAITASLDRTLRIHCVLRPRIVGRTLNGHPHAVARWHSHLCTSWTPLADRRSHTRRRSRTARRTQSSMRLLTHEMLGTQPPRTKRTRVHLILTDFSMGARDATRRRHSVRELRQSHAIGVRACAFTQAHN